MKKKNLNIRLKEFDMAAEFKMASNLISIPKNSV
jgi:hypothetical protein